MARLVDCCPSSGDELPDINSILQGNRKTSRTRSAQSKTASAKQPPTSKSTVETRTRRVRRLGEPSQAVDNPLFKRWNSEEHDSSQDLVKAKGTNASRAQPKVVRQIPEMNLAKGPESSSESEDDGPRLRARQPRNKRRVIVDSDDESEEGTQSNVSSEDEHTLLTRVRQLRNARIAATPKLTVGKSALSLDEEDEKAAAKPSVKEIDPDSEFEETLDHIDDAEEPSIYQTAEDEGSDSSDDLGSDFEADGSPDQSKDKPTRLLFKGLQQNLPTTENQSPAEDDLLLKPRLLIKSNSTVGKPKARDEKGSTKGKSTAGQLADSLAKLRLQLQDFSEEEDKSTTTDKFTTPPTTPPRDSKPKGLASPTKRIRIPHTPHRPSVDAFWSQDFVDDWNDQHSPRKLLLPPVDKKSPVKRTAKKEPSKKETKKAFEARKHALAESFLRELDTQITEGKIADMAASTGGVKLVWTKTLNTTAGRANWRRETTRTRKADGTEVSVAYKHHASIDLAEKVIDDEDRLLNVLAHEFCHLATFMVTGMTTNPHGREFKAWAARCSQEFGDRGIVVTTKHTYEIDFKYVWTCDACGAEFKRHSRSIDPARHRCGSCKGMLQQTKPVPRGKGKTAAAAAAAPGTPAASMTRAPSRYQEFVREQMSVVRRENPASPQKDMMRLVAEKWARQEGAKKKKTTTKEAKEAKDDGVGGVVGKMQNLEL